jgi:predicted RNase H-like HicB family nuclease
MTRKFTVTITRKGSEYVAQCPEVPGAVARGKSKNDAMEKIRAILRKKLDGSSDGGSDDSDAPKPHPVSPPPRGPTRGAEVV